MRAATGAMPLIKSGRATGSHSTYRCTTELTVAELMAEIIADAQRIIGQQRRRGKNSDDRMAPYI